VSRQPEEHDDHQSLYQMADELFSRPGCTHIVSAPPSQDAHLGLHSQHVHLERQEGGFKALYPILISNLKTEDYSSLEDVYQRHPEWRNTNWQDISEYPDLPYNTRYQPLANSIEVWAMLDRDSDPDDGMYIAYGAAEVVSLTPAFRKQLRPQDNWLMVKHPGRTWRVVSTKLVLKKRGKIDRAFHHFLYRIGFYGFLLKVKMRVMMWSPSVGKQSTRPEQEPGFLVVYGKPPNNWRDAEQHILSRDS
jgi:hypothetical protein